MKIAATTVASQLLRLPWHTPLEQWTDDLLAALPQGISRHVVRFINLDDRVIAVKEIGEFTAHHEYRMLRDLGRMGAPAVRPLAVITGRKDADGNPLTAALVTEHLQYSLPYRAVFSQQVTPDTVVRLIDSLAVLLVRLHLQGFYWGDVSLSNTLFRRDADAFSAYLVDAETGDLKGSLSDQRRLYDVDVARTNIIGELMDLQAGGLLDCGVDVIDIGTRIEERYTGLWQELTGEESIGLEEAWRVDERIRRLNDLGFDVGELKVTSEDNRVVFRPRVVDAGHHHRQLMRLTGLDVQEQQARRMLNSMQTYRLAAGLENMPLEQVAHRWVSEVFEATISQVPAGLKGKLQDAQIFHEILEHRWYMAEKRRADVSLAEATRSYIDLVLPGHRDEAVYLPTGDDDDTDGAGLDALVDFG
nr:DUF4032 domain-containing protein [Corynebacterium lactis]